MSALARASRQTGFSLLEILVAFVIMAMSLGVLYQTLGGSIRANAAAEERLRAILLAESVLARFASVPPEGVMAEGEEGGLRWRVGSAELPGLDEHPQAWKLHQLEVEVSAGAEAEAVFRLFTIRPEVDPGQSGSGQRLR